MSAITTIAYCYEFLLSRLGSAVSATREGSSGSAFGFGRVLRKRQFRRPAVQASLIAKISAAHAAKALGADRDTNRFRAGCAD